MSRRRSRSTTLTVRVFDDVRRAGAATRPPTPPPALRDAIATRGEANVMLATGNSQLAFLAELVDVHRRRLVARHRVPHGRVRRAAAHALRELPALHARAGRGDSCRSRSSTTSRATPATRRPRPSATPALLRAHPLDLCCCGIGENGHLAFNDPPVADFDDPADVKIVALEPASRRQQVGEGHFATIDDVPTHAITVTIPALAARAAACSAIVPEARKAEPGARRAARARSPPRARRRTCAAQPHATLYLDAESASLLDVVTRARRSQPSR